MKKPAHIRWQRFLPALAAGLLALGLCACGKQADTLPERLSAAAGGSAGTYSAAALRSVVRAPSGAKRDADTDFPPRPPHAPETEAEITPVPVDRAQAGDYILFGTYEQDNDLANGAEPIEWLVLTEEDGRLFVVSRYLLDSQIFGEKTMKNQWENCELRPWLNETFFNTAFTDEEKEKIPTVTVPESKHPLYVRLYGHTTEDKLFCLSYEEADTYLPTEAERLCVPTPYAMAQGAWKNDDTGYGWWWLRTPAHKLTFMTVVTSWGKLGWFSRYADGAGVGVRPAMWIEP